MPPTAVFLDEVMEVINEYSKKYRNPSQPIFDISELYALDMNEELINDVKHRWPAGYPNGGLPGVYLVLSHNRQTLYIGKASWNSCVAARLNSYFKYDDQRNYKVVHNWSKEPRYVATVTVPEENSFEASALEEYLIMKFKSRLPDNKIGTLQ